MVDFDDWVDLGDDYVVDLYDDYVPAFVKPSVIGPNTDDGPYDWSWQYGDPIPRLVQVDFMSRV